MSWFLKLLTRHRAALVGFVLIAAIVFVALIGPLLTPYVPSDVAAPYLEPSAEHWLGTDSQGYDLMTRMIYGSRITLLIALAATVLSMALGS